MVIIEKKNHATSLLNLLAISGEFPYCSLNLIGNARSVRKLVMKMSEEEIVRINGDTIPKPMRLLQCSGKGTMRTIRLTKHCVSILDQIEPGLRQLYGDFTVRNRFSGNIAHIGRNHRTAESLAMMMQADIRFSFLSLDKLKHNSTKRLSFRKPAFYLSRYLKELESDAEKKQTGRASPARFFIQMIIMLYTTRVHP